MYNLKGKTAIVSGSGRKGGIGEAIIMMLASEGCNVVISDLGVAQGENFSAEHIGSSTEMEEIAAAAKALGVGAISVPCDVRNEDQVSNLVAEAVKAFGGLDIMVSNAGVGYIMESFQI